jgi:hypothetical protein
MQTKKVMNRRQRRILPQTAGLLTVAQASHGLVEILPPAKGLLLSEPFLPRG